VRARTHLNPRACAGYAAIMSDDEDFMQESDQEESVPQIFHFLVLCSDTRADTISSTKTMTKKNPATLTSKTNTTTRSN
jgi:hypothetical protein